MDCEIVPVNVCVSESDGACIHWRDSMSNDKRQFALIMFAIYLLAAVMHGKPYGWWNSASCGVGMAYGKQCFALWVSSFDVSLIYYPTGKEKLPWAFGVSWKRFGEIQPSFQRAEI